MALAMLWRAFQALKIPPLVLRQCLRPILSSLKKNQRSAFMAMAISGWLRTAQRSDKAARLASCRGLLQTS